MIYDPQTPSLSEKLWPEILHKVYFVYYKLEYLTFLV